MNLTEKTYRKLRDDIFNAKYSPNEMISERQIAEKYDVSKLTAGEALHRLCSEGHLTSYPRSGYMVTTLSPAELEQVKKIRFALESLALENICKNASDDEIKALHEYIVKDPDHDENPTSSNNAFHNALAHLGGEGILENLITNMIGTLSRVEQQIPSWMRKHWQDKHEGILEALDERDYDKAVEYLREDLEQTKA